MKNLLLIILLIAAIPQGKDQGTALYDESGKLKFDGDYSVDPVFLPFIRNIERVMHRIYQEIEYPWMLADNGIGGVVIAKIHVNNDRMDLYCEIANRSDPQLDAAVVKAVHKQALTILRCTKGTDNFVFFLPFKFEVTTSPILQDMEEHKVVRIKTHRLEPVKVLL